jgi:hypothetical protein
LAQRQRKALACRSGYSHQDNDDQPPDYSDRNFRFDSPILTRRLHQTASFGKDSAGFLVLSGADKGLV